MLEVYKLFLVRRGVKYSPTFALLFAIYEQPLTQALSELELQF